MTHERLQPSTRFASAAQIRAWLGFDAIPLVR